MATPGRGWYTLVMKHPHPKSVRRRILQMLYDRYVENPLSLSLPDELLEDGSIPRDALFVNACYLHDAGLIEVKHGYVPNMFDACRIAPAGIDLVESRVEFDLRFPPHPDTIEEHASRVPSLMERIVEEAEFAPLDGEARRCLLRDVHYLREEVVRPVERWRREVIWTVIEWLEGWFDHPEKAFPTMGDLKAALMAAQARVPSSSPPGSN